MRQRGSISPELAIASGLLIVLLIALAGAFWYVGKERAKAFDQGRVAERSEWMQRDNEEVRMANAALVQAQAHARAVEQQAAQDLVALETEYEKELANAKAQRDRFMDDLATGRVRFHADIAAACTGPDRSTSSPATAAARVGDAQAGAELPPALQRAVAGGAKLADEADAVVLQLTEAQGYIGILLKACEAWGPA